ncbi:ABC transporter permease subunit [Ensifer sp. MJa1]|uniref:ABC transporter permease subunit n=1 Tax=Ensifer sp. MJa1 TaxID=2919888 RepID=UPI00300999A1
MLPIGGCMSAHVERDAARDQPIAPLFKMFPAKTRRRNLFRHSRQFRTNMPIIRAGLQVIPAGQKEAALSVGLSQIQMLRLVVLPQALRAVIPAIVNLSIGIVLNTSLLAVIGFYDLLNAAKTSATDPNWLGFYSEAYIFAALVYFAICFTGSRYSLWLERKLNGAGHR